MKRSPRSRNQSHRALHKTKSLDLKMRLRHLALAVMLVLLIGLCSWIDEHPWLALQNLYIDKQTNASRVKQLARVLAPSIGHSLLVLNTKALQNQLEALPWVAHASLRRVWPHGLALAFVPEMPKAYWVRHGVVTPKGILFKPTEKGITKNLPRVKASSKNLKQALDRLSLIQTLLKDQSYHVTTLEWEDSDIARVKLSTGLWVIVDDAHLKEAVLRLIHVYPEVFEDRAPSEYYLDFRYAHGFALGRQTHSKHS